MSLNNFEILLFPDPDHYNRPKDNMWQEECESLYLDISNQILDDGITVRPTKKKGSEDRRGADIYYILSASVASIGGFKAIYDLLKLWIDNRNQNRERVSVKVKIGSIEIDISNISKEEACVLYEKYREQREEEE